MEEQWKRIEGRLQDLGCLDEMGLRDGASMETIAGLERELGVTLPEDLKQFLAVHDGQDSPSGLIYGHMFLSCAEILQQWQGWRSLDEEEMNEDCADFMKSDPEAVIKPMYCNPAWIPLTHDGGGNHLGLDYDPDRLGQAGQIIMFGRDEDTKRLVAPEFAGFVERFLVWLEEASWNEEYLEGEDPF